MATFRFFDIYSSTVQADVKTDKDISEDLYKHTNPRSLDVYADLVLVFKYKQPTLKEATVAKPEYEQKTLAAYQEVLTSLTRVGLQYETRPSGSDTLLIFILCPWVVLKREATRASINDWLAGVKVADTSETEQLLQPAKERDQSLDQLTESDRLRLISDLITNMPSEGGAGIHPNHHDYVDSILPLHDKAFNKSWLKSWSKKVIVNEQDLSRVRDHFGEKVAYYFEFLQYYLQWLAAPTALGVLVHFFGSSFSIFYGVFVIIWAAFFTETWKRREKELALMWKVQNVSKTEQRRPSFKGTMAADPVTGEMVPFFSPWKRWTRKLLGIPIVLGGALALTTVISAVFGIEVFLTIYYDGYLKEYLIYAPMVLYSLAIPNVAAICKSISYRLTEYENYETSGSHEYHLMQKVFIFNALTSYMSILLTAYVYIPYGPQVISTFQAYGLSFSSATIDPHMLQNRLKAFMITTQAISFATETIVPWLTRRAKVQAVKIQKEVAEKLHRDTHEDGSLTVLEDSEDAKKFLKRVQKQADLPEYDVNEDYAEMVLQFGYVSLFSVIWPLTGLCAFINNWVELRSDAAKISYNARRPIPSRTDTIGPWLDNLQHIAWFSSLTNASILYLFHGTIDSADSHGPRLGLGMLLLTLLVSEHAYLALRMVVGLILDSIPTEAEIDVRRREFGVKRSWLSRLGDAIGFNSVGGVSGLAKRAEEIVDLSAQLENDFGVQAIRSNLKTN
ncbi:MAG: calcium-activated chloride channel-domain-containing protein [Linnemannia elongata]|nr:MAG: calcium-activated chloride channel-domain-containing protein [Linnemannia elongata]